MLEKYYPVHSIAELSAFFESYIPLIKHSLSTFNINLENFGISGDHLGLQVLSGDEFDSVHQLISSYSEVIKEGVIHERRNNTYKLNDFIIADGIELQSIEMFEPKPDAAISKLKPGFEHIAMKVEKYDDLKDYFKRDKLPIDKSVEYGGSRFFKTKFVNLTEIEFRNSYLWQSLLNEKSSQHRL